MLTPPEREEIERSHSALIQLCELTPEKYPECEAQILILLTKVMFVLPSSHQNEPAAEATGEAFQAALDDLPAWAVASAIRKWYRGECGKNERGELYDNRWRPAPADLRRLTFLERAPMLNRARSLERLLKAEPLREFSEEHTSRMRERMAALVESIKRP